MVRTLSILLATLALTSAAHAESETVRLHGKTGDAIRAELMDVAVRVCTSPADDFYQNVDSECVNRTYVKALHKAKRVAPEAFESSVAQHEQVAERQ